VTGGEFAGLSQSLLEQIVLDAERPNCLLVSVVGRRELHIL